MPGERRVRSKFRYFPLLRARQYPTLWSCCDLNVLTRLKTASPTITEYYMSFLSFCEKEEDLERTYAQAEDFGRRSEFESCRYLQHVRVLSSVISQLGAWWRRCQFF